jgi:uncharacterized protein YecE (DUF72 family)
MESGTVRIGTSGWNYPSGRGKWNGVFYPPSRGRSRDFDELAFYARHFNTVEVNSTFYGQPRPEVTEGWAERTPRGFEFSIKLYQKFTHPGMYRQRVARGLPEDLQDAASIVDALVRPNGADIDEFRRGIEPLAGRGRLGALLAQFPASFKVGEPQREYVRSLLGAFQDYPVAVELRHRSWSDAFGATLDLLNEHKAAWVQIDEPKFQFSIRQNYLPNVQGFYYMRLHGRNAAKWWRHDNSEERYDYLYTASELAPFAETIGAARRIVRKTYLYTNNHFSAKSVVNAAMIKAQLGEPDHHVPERLLDAYPELRNVLAVERQPLSRPAPS